MRRQGYSWEASGRKGNFNVQAWIDVKVMADLARYYEAKISIGEKITASTIVRWCIEIVHKHVAAGWTNQAMCETSTQALDILNKMGISTAQLGYDERARRLMSKTLAEEDRRGSDFDPLGSFIVDSKDPIPTQQTSGDKRDTPEVPREKVDEAKRLFREMHGYDLE